MSMTGTLEEVLARLFDLYMENRISDESAKWFLMRLKHEDGTFVFAEEDADKLLKTLRRDKTKYE